MFFLELPKDFATRNPKKFWEFTYDETVKVENGLACIKSQSTYEYLKRCGYKDIPPERICEKCNLAFATVKECKKHKKEEHGVNK